VHARGHPYIALGLISATSAIARTCSTLMSVSSNYRHRCLGRFAQRTQADFLTDFGNSITRPRCSEGTHFTFLGKGSGT
jgi:hypothetical protein